MLEDVKVKARKKDDWSNMNARKLLSFSILYTTDSVDMEDQLKLYTEYHIAD